MFLKRFYLKEIETKTVTLEEWIQNHVYRKISQLKYMKCIIYAYYISYISENDLVDLLIFIIVGTYLLSKYIRR